MEVTSPKQLIYPLLINRSDGLAIHPLGKFVGTYFSEELKAVIAAGYKIKLISGYEFSKVNIFTDYINHFYNIKKISKGAERFISKLHLNTLYGYFGRSLDGLDTVIYDKANIDSELLESGLVKNYYEVDEESMFLIMNGGVSGFIKSNVAIASAVTSYARVEMMKVKTYCKDNKINIFYTDTDSIFIDKPLPARLIGDTIGLYKDEMNGLLIQEGYFLGIKQYGYYYYDQNNNKIQKSVFAGVSRDSLTFDDVVKISKGHSLLIPIKDRFFRSLNNLNVRIADTQTTVSKSKVKILKGNVYQPKNIKHF